LTAAKSPRSQLTVAKYIRSQLDVAKSPSSQLCLSVVCLSYWQHRRTSVVSLKNNGLHFCGGALVSLKHVLTAGHCVVE
ncbi:unnamed protein product, partial [Timema podura]|nr:unnamed protein product [Timema podura]